jgi:hypothetical protein
MGCIKVIYLTTNLQLLLTETNDAFKTVDLFDLCGFY